MTHASQQVLDRKLKDKWQRIEAERDEALATIENTHNRLKWLAQDIYAAEPTFDSISLTALSWRGQAEEALSQVAALVEALSLYADKLRWSSARDEYSEHGWPSCKDRNLFAYTDGPRIAREALSNLPATAKEMVTERDQLRRLLEEAMRGLEWWEQTYPESHSEVDEEFKVRAKAILHGEAP